MIVVGLNKQKGMTLIELTVVLLILIALAGVTVPYAVGTGRKSMCDATDLSMMNIKKVIMEKYYLDTLGYFPKNTKDNTVLTDYSLNFLFKKPSGWGNFAPDSQVGWRGPYLQNGMILDPANLGKLDASFTNATIAVDGNVNQAFAQGDNIVLDAWGRPFVLQVPTVANCKTILGLAINPSKGQCARLVSAGFGSGVGMGKGSIDTLLTGGRVNDDRILYLSTSTLAGDINPPCDN